MKFYERLKIESRYGKHTDTETTGTEQHTQNNRE